MRRLHCHEDDIRRRYQFRDGVRAGHVLPAGYQLREAFFAIPRDGAVEDLPRLLADVVPGDLVVLREHQGARQPELAQACPAHLHPCEAHGRTTPIP